MNEDIPRFSTIQVVVDPPVGKLPKILDKTTQLGVNILWHNPSKGEVPQELPLVSMHWDNHAIHKYLSLRPLSQNTSTSYKYLQLQEDLTN